MLTILDEYTRECHVLRADHALKSGDVLDWIEHRNAGVLCARMSLRPDSKGRSTSEHNGVENVCLPVKKAPAGRYAPVTPM